MSEIFLGLGSNMNREANIRFALDTLQEIFGKFECSPVYESESVGFAGTNFYNLVVKIESSTGVVDLGNTLRKIEDDAGRDRSKPKFSPRTLDIDILLVDNLVGNFEGIVLPRDEILKNAFVLLPLSELAPDLVHPIAGESYLKLWNNFDKEKQKLWRVDFK